MESDSISFYTWWQLIIEFTWNLIIKIVNLVKTFKYNILLGIAGLFTVFSSVVFTSSVVNFGRSDISDLK